MARLISYERDSQRGTHFKIFAAQQGRKKVLRFLSVITLVLILPFAVFIAREQQELRQRAEEKVNQAFAITDSTGNLLPQPSPGVFTTHTLDVQVKLADANALDSYTTGTPSSTPQPTVQPTAILSPTEEASPTPTAAPSSPTPTRIAPSNTVTPSPTVTPGDSIVPVVSITNPINGSTVPKNTIIYISANASDAGGVAKVVFSLSSGEVICTVTGPYICPWQVPKKANVSYSLQAKAYDQAGNTAVSLVTVKAK